MVKTIKKSENEDEIKKKLAKLKAELKQQTKVGTKKPAKAKKEAIQKAAKTRFGGENEIRVIIDRETGEINLHKVLTVVETPEN